jgi:hypothetical protein
MSDNTRHASIPEGNASRARIYFLADEIPVDGVTAGGARRNRTDDLLLAKQALSQLSYGPASHGTQQKREMVGLGRFELPTSRLSSARSNQLSYRPKKHTLAPRNRKGRGQKDAPTTFG